MKFFRLVAIENMPYGEIYDVGYFRTRTAAELVKLRMQKEDKKGYWLYNIHEEELIEEEGDVNG